MDQPSLPSPLPAAPSWTMVFGLILVILLIGFFLMYLVVRVSKQERTLEALRQQTQTIPSPEDVFGMIQQCYHSPQFQQPMMRNIHSMVETRLNDFDQYCRSQYVRLPERTNQPASSSAQQLPQQPPPLEDETGQVCTTADGRCSASSDSSGVCSLPTATPTTATPTTVASSEGREAAPTTFTAGSYLRSAGVPQTERGTPNVVRPLHHSSSTQGTSIISASTLSEFLPSILSMFTQGRSNDSNVNLPILFGDFMTLMSNQQSRQQRRDQLLSSREQQQQQQQPDVADSRTPEGSAQQ